MTAKIEGLRTCPAELRGSAFDESEAWKEGVSFVSRGSDWSPVAVAEDDDGRGYTEAFAIGYCYAMEMIAHLKDFGRVGDAECGARLVQVIEAILKSGRFGSIERAFCYGLGSYIATGSIPVSSFWEAHLPDMRLTTEKRNAARLQRETVS